MTEITIKDISYIEADGDTCTQCDLEPMSNECRSVRCAPKHRRDGRHVVFKLKTEQQRDRSPNLW